MNPPCGDSPGNDAISEVHPIERRGRLVCIDAIKGIALLGIVIENVRFFSMPFARAIASPWTIEGNTLDRILAALDLAFGHQKFLALFTLLFGFGLAAQRKRLIAARSPMLPFEFRRLFWLGAIGLLHAFGLFFGDILFVFAGVGVMTLPLLGRSIRLRLPLSLFLILLSGVLVARTPLQRWLAPTSDAITQVATLPSIEITAPVETNTPDPLSMSASDPERRPLPAVGPWTDVTRERFNSWRGSMSYAVRFYGWFLFGLVLLGTVLHERGFFRPEAGSWRSRVSLGCLTIGLPLEIMHALPPEFRGAGGAVGVWWAFIHPIAAAAVAVGYAGVIATLVERGKLPMTRWFAAVGSMSLTAYLLQSIVLASIFRWWGLGWFGTVGQSMAIAIGVTVYGVVLVASLLWNRHFLLGPCEWLWRWFTYLQRPPIRRHAQSSTPQSTIDLQR
ncbi:MAG: DUF418 domain-containing protein [Phycisphaerales bacterium]